MERVRECWRVGERDGAGAARSASTSRGDRAGSVTEDATAVLGKCDDVIDGVVTSFLRTIARCKNGETGDPIGSPAVDYPSVEPCADIPQL